MNESILIQMLVNNRKAIETLYQNNQTIIDQLCTNESNILSLVKMGDRISAIRMYRQIHNCDLKTAKDAVDAIVLMNP